MLLIFHCGNELDISEVQINECIFARAPKQIVDACQRHALAFFPAKYKFENQIICRVIRRNLFHEMSHSRLYKGLVTLEFLGHAYYTSLFGRMSITVSDSNLLDFLNTICDAHCKKWLDNDFFAVEPFFECKAFGRFTPPSCISFPSR